jgi:serine-type D-Ala-D-Ala carboxypeptidase/endopeptidase
MRQSRLNVFVCVAICAVGSAYASGLGSAPSDAEIRQILVNRIDKEKQGIGIVIGVIDAKGRRVGIGEYYVFGKTVFGSPVFTV